MSRLPRLHTDHENLGAGTSTISLTTSGPPSSSSLPLMATLKRKAINSGDDDQDRPRKLPAIQESTAVSQLPLRPLKAATNLNSQSIKPAPTTLKPPATTTTGPRRVITRATSAPPKSSAVSSRLGVSTARQPVSNRNVTLRSVSYGRTKAVPPDDENHLQELKNQVAMIESARAADAARLAADMESERAKLSELQANHLVFSRELAATRSQEVSQKRELMNFQDELDSINKKHAREIADLEADIRKRDRKVQELEEDLRLSAQDLSRERSNSSILKATISEQSTTHVTLKAQINAMQAQLTAIQASSDSNSSTAAEYRLKWEDAERKAQQLEQDLQEAEMSRRRLHNMVQELKGNIRVFCRVRPVLPSEIKVFDGPPMDHSEVTAMIEYPDRLDHKEIVLRSTSESATGQERKETWQFTFDRVCISFTFWRLPAHKTNLGLRTSVDPIRSLRRHLTTCSELCRWVQCLHFCVRADWVWQIFHYGRWAFGIDEGYDPSRRGASVPSCGNDEEKGLGVQDGGPILGDCEYEIVVLGVLPLTGSAQYNETINDLLGTGELDKKKHEIKHDKTSTRVTDVNVISLHSATQVQSLLSLAKSRRTVAATLMKYAVASNFLRIDLIIFLPANVRPAHIQSLLFGYREGTSQAETPAKVR